MPKQKRIYFDHAATTYLDDRVKKAMDPYWSKNFGNPSSLYKEGLDARIAVDNARKKVAGLLNAGFDEIVFTNGGTESDNMAVFGTVRNNKHFGNHIITTMIEHHAVLESFERLEKEGFRATYVKPDKYGIIDPKEIERAITPETIFVSVMYANNEVGTVQSIAEISRVIAEKEKEMKHRIYFHTDACQAAGYLDMNIKDLGVDLLTLNGSKLYGPKAVGVLYIKRGVKLEPIIYGGGQENGLRSGTENVPGVIGLATALELAQKDRQKESERLIKLRDYLIKNILKNTPKSFLNGHPTKRLPNNVNVSILDIEGEAMILKLDYEGIAVSTGSACTSRSLEPSHVLRAMGLPYEAAHGSLRISLGKKSTKAEADYLLKVLPRIVKELKELSPLNLKTKHFN
jgi:cysteine desulfurase